MKRALAALVPAMLAGAPVQALEVITSRYHCERGIEIPVTYINEGAGGEPGSAVVLNVEGSQITLMIGRSGSGARYEWPSDGSGYVWWIKGRDATLYWKDGASGTETPILTECSEAP